MDPQDDPEARIRDLERPLSDMARTSEMGAAQPGPYGYPPTPPPITYGGPYPTTPPRTTAGLRLWWIVLAVFAVGAIAVAAGVAVFGAHLFSSRGSIVSSPSVRPSISRGSVTKAPSTGGSTVTAPPGGNLTVTGISENRTIACNDSVVTVSGITNTVVLTGHCASLTVLGSQNVVTVNTADTIDTSGIENQITFHSGSPTVQNSGISNVVQQG
jgi:hypothetical protein